MRDTQWIKGVLVLALLFSGVAVHAQAACPPGTVPYGTGNGPSACGPDDSQPQQSARPQRPPEIWVDHFGAIATDEPRGAMGASTYMQDRHSAENSAIADCHAEGGVNCVVQISYGNECVALVVSGKFFNVNDGDTVDQATKNGMEVCKTVANDCQVYYSACSLPIRIQ